MFCNRKFIFDHFCYLYCSACMFQNTSFVFINTKSCSKIWLCLRNLLAFSPAAYSKNITPRKAAKIAQRYVTLPQSQEVKAKSKGFSQTADTPYYIYNDARGSGFVIVSGDDEMGEILAYSTEGTLDTLNANPCVKLLLEGYRQTYEVLKEGKVDVRKDTPIRSVFSNRITSTEKQMGTVSSF